MRNALILRVVILVAFCAWFWAWCYGRWIYYEPPGPKKVEACDGGAEYRWSIGQHRYVCHDNWLFPGVHGV